MASNVDNRDKSFTSKFRDYFIEEDDADSAAISPYASISEADLCTYYTLEDFLSRFGRHNKNSFSIASLNVKSLPGQWDALKFLVQELNSGTVKINCLCLQEIWCVPPQWLPPHFYHGGILVEKIGMQVEELHSGVTQTLPVLVFQTLVSLNLMCLSLYLLKLQLPLGNSLL